MSSEAAAKQGSFHHIIPGQIAEIESLTEALRGWSERHGIPARTVNSIILMLDELLTNVVMHGYGDYGDHDSGEIEVTVLPITNGVEVIIRDSAPAFDPFSIAEPDTTLDIDERDIGGLGVHFVRKMADSFAYRRDGDFNEVHFSKSFPS
ncbi:ATP-binding protein [Undibacterium pigrum]|uniref:Serine/threonine-protein kinase RsbW n=1 Tax=Undibacterium pigrum TaxID=401470 RepID=A0A318IYC2_9BURK|nr:ATP-binding protein [Undibacterium pigrum]PXX40204.1 serine/threonine-protein kinase RsbW [Undibacterium pigrum]